MKSWFKGGLWGIGVVLFIDIIAWILVYLTTGSRFSELMFAVITIPYILIYFVLVGVFGAPFDGPDPTRFTEIMWFVLTICLEALIIFLIGALIGLIISKLKRKKT